MYLAHYIAANDSRLCFTVADQSQIVEFDIGSDVYFQNVVHKTKFLLAIDIVPFNLVTVLVNCTLYCGDVLCS